MKKILLVFSVILQICSFTGCKKEVKEPSFTYEMFLMNVPAHVRIYTTSEPQAKAVADAVFKEWERINKEYSFLEPYSHVSYVNSRALMEPVEINEEFYYLLNLSMHYYNLTKGAFDITFAPLWPIWREAASSKKMPAREQIQKALENIGSNHIQIDHKKRTVKFTKPVQIDIRGILRSYCFIRGYKILKEMVGNSYPVELRLGGYLLSYGKRKWEYNVPDPINEKRSLGKFIFDEGVVLSSSGRDKFVQIEGKVFSHILNLKTGYPIENFSNFIVYFPDIESKDFMPSVVLALMGKEESFKLLSKMRGTAGVWVDDRGKFDVFQNENSKASWVQSKKFLF